MAVRRAGEVGAGHCGITSGVTQAKWDTRRMLGDLGHDIETSLFGIVEMAYTYGLTNTFQLTQTNPGN